jgi:hypothetical protein
LKSIEHAQCNVYAETKDLDHANLHVMLVRSVIRPSSFIIYNSQYSHKFSMCLVLIGNGLNQLLFSGHVTREV